MDQECEVPTQIPNDYNFFGALINPVQHIENTTEFHPHNDELIQTPLN